MNPIAKQKLNQAAAYLKEQQIDLWILFSSEGSDPAVSLLLGLKTVGRTFFLLTPEGKRYALCTVIDAQESADSGLFDEIIRYQGDPAEALKSLVERINPGKIAINYSMDDHLCDGLTTGRYRYLKNALGNDYAARLVSAQPILTKLRSIKTPEEITALKEAARVTEEIYDEVFAAIQPGMTEKDIGQLFIDGMNRRGVVMSFTRDLSMPIIMKERFAHRAPGDAVIERGDFIIMDFGILLNGYASDIARTAYVLKEGETKAPDRYEEVFDAAYNAITAAFESVKPGIPGHVVDNAARTYLRSRNMPDITTATGHQIGTYAHDGGAILGPKWERYGNAPYGLLAPGMVFSLEPSIFNGEGDLSVICEEEILVTEQGAEFLTNRQEKLILIQ